LQNLEPAIKEFSVTAPLLLEPDGVFLLEGAKAHFTLYERAVNENREKVLNGKHFPMQWPRGLTRGAGPDTTLGMRVDSFQRGSLCAPLRASLAGSEKLCPFRP
jgi:hypothetical protein